MMKSIILEQMAINENRRLALLERKHNLEIELRSMRAKLQQVQREIEILRPLEYIKFEHKVDNNDTNPVI